MYPVRLGFDAAIKRIQSLQRNGHDAEALLTAVFTAEKTLRRTLRQLVVSSGFTSRIADKVMGGIRGLEAIKNAWEIYDPLHRKLAELLPAGDWEVIKKAAGMRNEIVHGAKVYEAKSCKIPATSVIKALKSIKKYFNAEYGYCGWTIAKARKRSRLHSHPTVTWSP